MMARLSWRREPIERGLAGVVQGERGWELRYGEYGELASVGPIYAKPFGRRDKLGYYWSCPSNRALGIEHRNTAQTPAPTVEEAKAEAEAYIRSCLPWMRKHKAVGAGEGER